MEQPTLFPELLPPATDDEVAEVLQGAISRGAGLSRLAELYLSAVGALRLVDELHMASLCVVRMPTSRAYSRHGWDSLASVA
jgi:hypothetical protein